MSEGKKATTRLFTKEDIKKASNVDIYEFLNAHGTGELKGGGRYPKYLINGHNSIVIDRKKNYFYHNGAHRGDTIIKLLQDYEGYSFPQAVAFLLGEEMTQHDLTTIALEDQGEFTYPYVHDTTTRQVENYLVNERGLDKEIVEYLIENDYLKQDIKYKNALFVWKEFGLPEGEVVGAMAQGTVINHERFGKRGTAKFIAKNSKSLYGFNVTLGTPEAYYFFESAIDLVSYWSMNKDLTNCRLMSLEGLKKNAVHQFIQETYLKFDQLPVKGMYFGMDNDAAGQRFFDDVSRSINVVKEIGGEAAPNIKLIPFDRQLSEESVQMYKDVSANYPQVQWEMLATVHKVETNLSNNNTIANDYGLHSTLAVIEGPNVKSEEIDVRSALHGVAQLIEKHHYTPETLAEVFFLDKDYTYTYRAEDGVVKKKVAAIYERYASGEYELVEEVGKDWNNAVTQARAQGLQTEKTPLIAKKSGDFIYDDMKEQFTYYLQDAPTKMKIKEQLIDTFGLHPTVITALVNKGMIRQDIHDRIVYLWTNQGQAVGGQIRGTFFDKKAFGRSGYEQKVMDHSQVGYGFNVTLGNPKKITFFQSPEDLLSYWSLNVDTLKDTVLFALSENDPTHVVSIINNKFNAGYPIKEVEMCINNNQAGMDLIDGMSQLADFDLTSRSIHTEQGAAVRLVSIRPKIGVDWLSELHAKKVRQERLQQYKSRDTQTQQKEQQVSYSRN